MSNNIYDILKTMRGLTESKKVCDDCGKTKCTCVNESAKPDFLDMDKDGDKKEPMKKAAKEKSKGAIAEAVARVEQQLAEKYMGFKKLAEERKEIPVGVIDGPGGYEEAQKRIKDYEAGKINKDGKPLPPVEDRSKPAETKPANQTKTKAVDESGLQAYLGKKKYGEQGMKALQQAGRDGASKEKMAKIRARHDKMDEGEYNEDMLSPKQKEFAKLAPPPDKITYADKIAGAKKGKKTEGNKFSGNLAKARAQGLKQADLDGDGDMEPVHEGWDEMLADVKKRSGPQPQGGSGFKAGKRYGGAAQQDEPDTDNETGEVAKKTRGRPKKDKFAK